MKFLLALLLASPVFAQLDYLNHNRPFLDAHNCYPYKGEFADRIDRALGTGFPVGIEQDLAWYVDPATHKGRIVVSHTNKVTGAEPDLRDYFFEKVRPIVEKALKDNDRARWPLIVVHFDFKMVPAPLLHAVWDLLGEYQSWITLAVKSADSHVLTPFEPKPLLVLTEEADAQEEVFYKEVPVGAKLRLFGSGRTKVIPESQKDQREHLLATLPPAELLPEPPTTYRRWWNSSWHTVEEGGQRVAGDWTASDNQRLRALVDHAHKLGYWIRFYTLDGYNPGESKGWDNNYNFGSHEAVRLRWQAEIDAGVNFLVSDQYEELGKFMKKP